MDVAVLTAFATPFMAMLAMLWHQQRTILKKLSEIGERLARVEGYLGVGMPPAAAARAAGESLDSDPAQIETQASKSDVQRSQAATGD